jgi:hypothetical protein
MRAYRYSLSAVAVLCIGLVLHATGSLHVEAGTWAPTPAMNSARSGAASVLMPDGRILVTGGSDANGNALASAEFFNADGSFSDAPAMASPRSGHSAVWLPTGYVLVAGGTTSGGGATNTAELFDPLSNQWRTLASTMVEARTEFTATVLRYGNVVIAGGSHAGVPVSSVEVFDISSETFSSAGALNTARANAAAAAVSDYKVLVAGGSDANGLTLASTELIDTEAGTITAGPALSSPRQSASATVLLDGKVLIAGGSYPEGAAVNAGVAELSSTDIYDPSAGVISAGPVLSAPRASHQAFLLPNNNNVLFVGGVSAGQDLPSADLYTPWTGTVATQPSMPAARKKATGSAMYSPAFRDGLDGVLLVAGGSNLSSGEMYGFATVRTDKDDYAPGTPVIITGSGWVPGETVTLSLLEYPNFDTHTLDPVTADANGNIYSDQFTPDANDLNIKFFLTANGSKSMAQNAFSDAISTSTAIASSINPSNVGQNVTFTATVTASGSPVTVGTVIFYNQTGLNNPNCTGQTGTQIGLQQSLSGTGTASVTTSFTPSGTYKIGACYNGTGGSGTQNSQSPSINQSVVATANPTFTGLTSPTITYGDSIVTLGGSFSNTPKPTGSVSITVNGVTQNATINGAGNFSSSFNTGTFPANAAGYTITYSYAGDSNFNAASDTSKKLIVNKAALTITADDKSMNFGGTVPTLSYTPTGFKNGEGAGVLSGAAALSTTATSSSPAGSYPITVAVGTLGATNYAFTFVNGTLTVGQADVTIVWSNLTSNYDGSSHAITATPTPVGAGLIVTYTGASYNSTTAPTNAGIYTATATLSDTTNYKFASGAQTSSSFTINKADPVMAATGGTFTYDTAAHAGSGTATGVGSDGALPVTLNYQDSSHNPIASAPVNAGSYFVVAHFAGNSNYNAKDSAPAAINIDKADPVMAATGGTFTYDTAAHAGSGTATGVGSDGALTPVTLNYQDSSHNPIANAPVNAGSYFVVAHFAGNSNYNAKDSAPAAITINKADANVTVTAYSGTYDAAAHGVTGSATGVGGVDLSAGLSLGATFTDVPGGTVHWTFAGGINYNDQSGDSAVVINKANASVTVNGFTGIYDALPHGATGSATGVGGVSLPGLSLGSSFTDVPGGTAHWTFAGGTNYNDQSGDVAIVINKASANVTVNGYTGTYDALPHGATGSASGVGGVNLSAGLSLGASFIDVPGGTAHWSFAGGTNYNDQSGDVAIVIGKANASVTVTGHTVTFDGLSHGATGSATGVGGVDLSAGLSLGASFIDVPGGTAHWTFAGGTNYNDQSGDVAIVISKADAHVTVNGYNGTYDGLPHGATGSATGVGNVDLSAGLSLGASFIDVPGGTAHWTFAGGTNYNDQSGDVAIVINKADANVTVTGYSGTYDGLAHGASGSAIGVGGASLPGLSLGSSFTDAPGGSAHWTFTGGINYNDQSGDVAIALDKAASTTVVTCGGPYSYNGLPQTPCSVSVTGAGGLHVTPTPTYSNNLNAGIASASYSFPGDTNHTGSGDSKNFTIEKAAVTATAGSYNGIYDAIPHGPTACTVTGSYTGDLSCTNVPATVGPDVSSGSIAPNVTGTGLAENFTLTPINGSYSITQAISTTVVVCPASVTYSGAAQTPCTASVTGVGGLNQVLTVGYSNNTAAGSATASASYVGDLNHSASNDSKNFTINKATSTISVTGYNVIFDNAAHTATGNAKGVLGETLSGLSLSGTTHTLVGNYTDTWTFTDSTGNYLDASGTVNDSIGKWTLSGFYQPVTTYSGVVVWNIVKGGSTVPIKFNIYAGTVQRTDVAAVVGQSIALYQVNCQTPGVDDTLDEVVNTGSTSLRFDGSGAQFIQNWQTPKGANQCFLVQMTALDGSKLQAYFKTK